jgi:hypothetical protein
MIVETIFSTVDTSGRPNFAPMGVMWGEESMMLRPFRDTTTYHNLLETHCGVANLTDNVLSFVRTALSDAQLPHFPARCVRGVVLEEACAWRELEVVNVGGGKERADIHCRVVGQGRLREFLGFNRGKNAVIEAAILATRLHLHSPADIRSALRNWKDIVSRTGGEQEREAVQYVQDYIARWLRARQD